MTMTRKMSLIGLGGLVLAVVSALGFAAVKSERADCPGKIVCPMTGELVCRDQCPLVDATRPDCPGRIVCPLTGELVCKDKCPVAEKTASAGTAVPTCCQKK